MSDGIIGGQEVRSEVSGMEQIVRASGGGTTDQGTGTTDEGSGSAGSEENSGDSASSTSQAVNFLTTTTKSASKSTSTSSTGGVSQSDDEWVKVTLDSSQVVYELTNQLTINYENKRDASLDTFSWLGNGGESIYDGKATEDTSDGAVFNKSSNSGVVLNLSYLNEGSRADKYLGKSMRIQIGWTSGNFSGNSSSDFFAVVRAQGAEALAASAAVSSASAASITNGVMETATEVVGTSATESTTANESKKSGLGGGAIAGIVIGVVGGLLLIAAAAFFLLRKRRKNKNVGENYAAADSANAYMVDKETQGRATDTPNSPYSDENQARSLPIDETHHDEPAITTAPMGGVPRTSTGGSHNSRAETPQGVSTNVAHLVEEGMTLDEIRRLEEEERQLDDEIERAARR